MVLSIIIPIYNEIDFIEEVFRQLVNVGMPGFVSDIEYIVVDDFSQDGSYQKVLELSENNKNIQVFRHPANKGKGAAVKTGIKNSSGDVILVQDADLELNPKDIPRLLNSMEELKVDFINGSRFMPGLNRPLYSYRRYLANRFFTFLTSVLINVKLTDMACGYKLIKRELLDKINLNENRFGFEAELIIKAMRVKKNNIAEVPVHYFPRNEGEGKKIRNSDGLRILRTVIRYGLFRMQ